MDVIHASKAWMPQVSPMREPLNGRDCDTSFEDERHGLESFPDDEQPSSPGEEGPGGSSSTVRWWDVSALVEKAWGRTVAPLRHRYLWRTFVDFDEGFQYLAFFIWGLLITISYLFTRLLAIRGFPPDGDPVWDHKRAFADLVGLYTLLLAVLWMTRGFHRDRVHYFFITCWWAPMVLIGVSPLFSWITLWPPLMNSLATVSVWGPYMWLFAAVLIALLLASAISHVYYAATKLPRQTLVVYLTTRLALAIFMGVGVWAVAHLEDQRLHLHHWFTMQLAATIASFNTKISAATLAVCLGMMSHGVAAYGYGGILSLFFIDSPHCSFFKARNASVFESLEAIVSPPSVSPPGKVISLWTCAYPRLLNATEIVSWKGTSAVQGDWYFDAVADDWYPPPVDF